MDRQKTTGKEREREREKINKWTDKRQLAKRERDRQKETERDRERERVDGRWG